ncbi:hypothetical protein TTRE_0000163601 [Trichuris trichiura]|uniref:Uncharacterized protein n=1 Tax=Trichuris trichiura TaxID=36087 RepID=A0A077YZ67_TRITR|nr:hypothetical protein TTRE_0000163601 [Trichuris trichiura]
MPKPLWCWTGEDEDVKSDLKKVELTNQEKKKYNNAMKVYKTEVKFCMMDMCVGIKRRLQKWGTSNGDPRALLDQFAECKADCEKANKSILDEIKDIDKKKKCHDIMVQYLALGYNDLAERAYLNYRTSLME